jgi:hypothetical protein
MGELADAVLNRRIAAFKFKFDNAKLHLRAIFVTAAALGDAEDVLEVIVERERRCQHLAFSSLHKMGFFANSLAGLVWRIWNQCRRSNLSTSGRRLSTQMSSGSADGAFSSDWPAFSSLTPANWFATAAGFVIVRGSSGAGVQ